MVESARPVDVLLTGSENSRAAEHFGSSSAPGSHSSSFSSVQVSPQHQAVAEATDKEGQQVHGGDDGKGGGPVTVVTVEVGMRRRGGGGEEHCI